MLYCRFVLNLNMHDFCFVFVVSCSSCCDKILLTIVLNYTKITTLLAAILMGLRLICNLVYCMVCIALRFAMY